MIVSQPFAARVVGNFGPAGQAWLAELPDILQHLSTRWSLILEPPIDPLSYNYVAPARRDGGQPVVLKVGVPSPELTAEIEALRAYQGRGTVCLLDADTHHGALLLERLMPGQPIVHVDDDEQATRIAICLMAEMHQARGYSEDTFPSIADWARGLDRLRTTFCGGTGPFPPTCVEQAESDLRELLASMGPPLLLHGDLHHWNIVSAQRSPWLAIDPKGLIGEAEYETGAWLRNPFPQLLRWTAAQEVIQRRIDQFASHLGVDRQRVRAWGSYQAVLAAWWSYESHDADWQTWLAIADLIAGSDRRVWSFHCHHGPQERRSCPG